MPWTCPRCDKCIAGHIISKKYEYTIVGPKKAVGPNK